MLEFISFSLKILIATIIGGALNYIPNNSEKNQNILESCLICLFAASILGFVSLLSDNIQSISTGLALIAVLIVVCMISKELEFRNRIMWLFTAAVGMLIGAGFIIQACFLGALFYVLLHNNKNILSYIQDNCNDKNESTLDNV